MSGRRTFGLTAAAFIAATALSAGTGCSSASSFTAGNLTEPEGVAIAVPGAEGDALPRTFAYVTDTAKDTVKVIDTSLRTFVEALIPYFPLQIPVGTRPTRIAVAPDHQTLYVINAVSRDISVIDTTLNIEAGAAWWDGTALRHDDPASGGPRRIYTGLLMNDLAAAFSSAKRVDHLYVAADQGDGTGLLLVYDAAKYLPDGKPNPGVFHVLRRVALPGVPGRIDVSPDGDTVWLSNRTGKTVMVVNVIAETLNEVDLGASTQFVKVIPPATGAGNVVYAGSKDARGMWVIDADRMAPVSFDLSPGHSLGTMLPVSFGVPQSIALAGATPLGDVLSKDAGQGCPGTVALMPLVNGQVAALDVSGCAVYTAVKDANSFSFIGKNAGLRGLFIEAETTTPYISVPTLWMPATAGAAGRVLTQDEQYFSQYPWDRSERNYGVTMSRLMRQFLNKAVGYVTYRGVVLTGAAGAFSDAQTFTEPGKDFVAAGVSPGEDELIITNPDGSPLLTCDGGAPLIQGTFPVTAVGKNTLTVEGSVPKADCIAAPFNWDVRARDTWTVIIEGLGLIGRAVPDQTFYYPPDADKPHMSFMVRSGSGGTATLQADMMFSFQIYFFAMSIAASEIVLMPTDIAVAEDAINPAANWAFVVYSGSAALFQFNPRTLDATVEILYR